MSVVKLNISLEPEVVEMLRRGSGVQGKSMSGYLSDLIRRDHRRRQDELAEEGYRLLNEDTAAFADVSLHLAKEVWSDWDATGREASPRRTAQKERAGGRKTATR